MDFIEIIMGIYVLTIGLYYWLTSTFDFWTSRGVPGPSPKPLFGSLSDVVFGKLSFAEFLNIEYDAHSDQRMFGIFLRSKPALVLTDLELIKDVLIRDFLTFPNRGIRIVDEYEPLTNHLFNIDEPLWRPLRKKLATVFTSTKLKKMSYLVLECGDHLEKHLAELTLENNEVECRELSAKFTMDIIGRCVFGLQFDTLGDENELREIAKRTLTTDWRTFVKSFIQESAPWFYSLIWPVMIDWKMTNYFLNIMRKTMEYRKDRSIVKDDFINLIIGLKDHPDKLGDIELTDILLTAQLTLFWIAGFETSAITISNVLYQLAQHQTIQDKLRDAVNQELAKTNGEITYEGIKSIKYLHMVLKETLRKYSPGFNFVRKSVKPYTFAGTNVIIPEDTFVIIPAFAIHRDPLIYPRPEVFDPERFTDEAIKSRHPMSWMAFGEGPRMCIGKDFANYQVKVGLVKILQNYKVDVCEKTRIPYVFAKDTTLLTPNHDIYLKMSKVD